MAVLPGAVEACLGAAADPAAHREAILVETEVDTRELGAHTPELQPLGELLAARPLEGAAFEREVAAREDLRALCVFSIDPAGARDLDDALHIVQLPAGQPDGAEVEVGIHIADVAHFVPRGSPLDSYARARSTTVYFGDRNFPMLPRALSEGLCSLTRGAPSPTLPRPRHGACCTSRRFPSCTSAGASAATQRAPTPR